MNNAENAAAATVLVVEDEESIRGLLRLTLEMHGHRVLTAGDAEAALQLSADHAGRIDLVITDMSLPGMSGRDLVARLAPTRPGLHVLYISGSSGETALPDAGGKMAYLGKPFTPRELLEVVRRMLGS